MNMDDFTINDAVTMRPGAEGGSALGSIDKYELVRELGEGGFGVVYLAHDTVAKTDVAGSSGRAPAQRTSRSLSASTLPIRPNSSTSSR